MSRLFLLFQIIPGQECLQYRDVRGYVECVVREQGIQLADKGFVYLYKGALDGQGGFPDVLRIRFLLGEQGVLVGQLLGGG